MNVIITSSQPSIADGSGGRYFVLAGMTGVPVSYCRQADGEGHDITVAVPALHFGLDGSFVAFESTEVTVPSEVLAVSPSSSPIDSRSSQ